MKRFTPTFYATKLIEVSADFFLGQGIQVLFCDLDNTLAPYDELLPNPAITKWINHLKHAGLTITIISNNKPSRVAPFAQALGLDYLAQTGKPFSGKLLKFLKKKGYPKDKVMVVGDQLLTDVWMANRCGIKSLFVEKLVSYDHLPTKLNRLIESLIKRYLKRHRRLHSWEERK
jgi:uncharacterized protein